MLAFTQDCNIYNPNQLKTLCSTIHSSLQYQKLVQSLNQVQAVILLQVFLLLYDFVCHYDFNLHHLPLNRNFNPSFKPSFNLFYLPLLHCLFHINLFLIKHHIIIKYYYFLHIVCLDFLYHLDFENNSFIYQLYYYY